MANNSTPMRHSLHDGITAAAPLCGLLLLVLLLALPLTAQAQGVRALPFLETNVDVRTAGMGHATFGDAESNFIYTSPTAFLANSDKPLDFGATAAISSYIDDDFTTLLGFTGAWRMADNHALLLGARYIHKPTITKEDEFGQRKSISPMDYSVDLAYALRMGDNWSAYIMGTFIQSYIGKMAITGGGSLGVSYRNSFLLSDREAPYAIDLSVTNLGAKVQYAKAGTKSSMPAAINLGGSLGMPLSNISHLNLAAFARYFVLPAEAREIQGGIGAEYLWRDRIAVRGGCFLQKDNLLPTIGAGYRGECMDVDLAYQFASNAAGQLLRLGFGFHF